MRNPTEDASLPVHPDSMCAQLTNKTLDDFCRDCAEPATFIMASATDFALKQAEDDIYYRERIASFGTCSDKNFYTYEGESGGFYGTYLQLDTWLPLDGVNCSLRAAILKSGNQTIDYGNIIPDIFSSTRKCWVPGGLPAGTYRIKYVTGAMEYAPCTIPCWNVNTVGAGYHVEYNNGSADLVFPAVTTARVTEAEVHSDNAGRFIDIMHTGGSICMYLQDAPYGDNVHGTPDPTFNLRKL